MKVSDLRGILTYVPRYRLKVFVIALDGEVIAHDNFANLLRDVAVLWNLNVRVVLVHGMSHQLKVWAQKHQLELSNADGTGPTDEATLEAAIVVANRITHEVMKGLSVVDLRGISSNSIIAQPVGILKGKDYQFTGKVERVESSVIQEALKQGTVPVLSPLGFDGEGRTYRVNSDAIAFAVAKELGASKIIFVTSQGKLRVGNQTIGQLSVTEAEDFLKASALEIPDVLRSKINYGIRACKEGISRVHLVNGTEDEALLGEIFLNEGTGTMVYANDYQAIRLARKQDVPAIHSLIQRAIENEELVPRTKTQITEQLEDYYVFEVDRNIIGCVALHLYPQEKTGELACLYVNSSHENAGIGQKLMTFIEKEARRKGMKQLFVLSTQAFTFFQQKGGFTEAKGSEILPKMRREKWEQSGRNSKVLVKKL
jgi:amino-acid N-acetyltransferase